MEQAGPGVRAIVLEGEAGVGKTALWRRALEAVGAQGWQALTSAPTASESHLSFAALGDLLEPGIEDALPDLPAPQREALEVALLRRGDGHGSIDERMIGVATLATLRALTATAPTVVAIDDVQWVDPASAASLRFALRRVRDEPLVLLATRRLEPHATVLDLVDTLDDDRVTRIRVGTLSLGGIHELLLGKLALDVPRPILHRLYELTSGNPLFALEIGRELIARGALPAATEALPVPGNVRKLVQQRFARLSPRARRTLLAVATLARPTRSQLLRLDEDADVALDEALSAGVIQLSGERVRFSHPLFASVHYEAAPLAERRRMHACLAAVVEDLEERARHLALAATTFDEAVAAELDDAARCGARRGAARSAAELSDLAARLTPGGTARARRLLAAAEHHHRAGDPRLAAERAREVAGSSAGADVRVRALAVLATVAADTESTEAAIEIYRCGLREPGAPRELRADLHQKLTWLALLRADAREASRHARAMLRLAAGADQVAEATGAATLSLVTAARGLPLPAGLLDRALAPVDDVRHVRPWAWSETAAASLHGVVHLWSGETERAAGPLWAMHRAAAESGDPWLEMHALAYLSSVETILGRPRRGWELAQRYLELAIASEQDAQRAGALWPVAVAATWLGRAEEAAAAAREGLGLAERTGHRLYVIGNLSALGTLALSQENFAAAAAALGRAREMTAAGGVESPARFPILADLVEAMLGEGDPAAAAAVAEDHRRIAARIGRPWVLALAARCEGLIAAAAGDNAGAVSAFERALSEHERQPRPLEHARTLLVYGIALRRRRSKSGASDVLKQAAEIFEAAGADQWAERARGEMGRIGGRRRSPAGTLSATEAAIARLVADGQTNREVAAALHLSARTVEWNLSKVYRKLSVRSRTELAAALRG